MTFYRVVVGLIRFSISFCLRHAQLIRRQRTQTCVICLPFNMNKDWGAK